MDGNIPDIDWNEKAEKAAKEMFENLIGRATIEVPVQFQCQVGCEMGRKYVKKVENEHLILEKTLNPSMQRFLYGKAMLKKNGSVSVKSIGTACTCMAWHM